MEPTPPPPCMMCTGLRSDKTGEATPAFKEICRVVDTHFSKISVDVLLELGLLGCVDCNEGQWRRWLHLWLQLGRRRLRR